MTARGPAVNDQTTVPGAGQSIGVSSDSRHSRGVRTANWLLRAFVVAAAVQVSGLFLDRQLLPYSGTVALGALLAFAMASPSRPGARRWPRRAALASLALLALTAGLVDARTGGYGWPAEFAAGRGGSGLVEAGLLTAATAAVAAAVLGHAGRLLRWRHIPAVLVALLVLVPFGTMALDPVTMPGETPPNRALRGAVLLLPTLSIVLVCLAVSAALASRRLGRWAAAGLFPILVLAAGALLATSRNDLVSARDDPAAVKAWFVPGPTQIGIDHYEVAAVRADPGFLEAQVRAQADSNLNPSAIVTRPAPPPERSDIPAVPGTPAWPTSLWQGDIDWARSLPALWAELLLFGLVTLVTSLFRADPHAWAPHALY